MKLLTLTCAVLVGCAIARGAAPTELSAMTFNIRYGTANDGPNAWAHRREMVLGVLRDRDADVVGLQEALRFQLDEIEAAVPQYAEIGVGRDDGLTKGEYSAILYRADRFGVAEAGTFWLSDTPEEVGSTSWGNSITRICTWARLVETETGRGFYVFNTHFDHRSQPSRERAAELIAARIATRAFDEPAILMGDFNAGEDNPAIEYLRGARASASGRDDAPASPELVDTFRAIHPDAAEVGTFSGFNLGATDGPKIDHLMVTPRVEVLDAGIDRTSGDGRYPSDHFPVWARVALPGG